MNKITCDICLDLMAIVKDGVASNDSDEAVMSHLKECPPCSEIFNSMYIEKHEMNESNVINRIKKQLYMVSFIIIVVGALVGVGLSESAGMFYNVLIMPIIGIIAYFALRKKTFYVPIFLFVFVYLWHFIKYLSGGLGSNEPLGFVFLVPMYWAFIYSFFCCLGTVIAFLLNFSFRKEKTYNEKNY